MSTFLVVPLEGMLQVVTQPDGVDVNTLLTEIGQGRYVDFRLYDHDEVIGRIGFLVSDNPADVNHRARGILAELTGVHMVVTGPAVFTGLDADRLHKIIAWHG